MCLIPRTETLFVPVRKAGKAKEKNGDKSTLFIKISEALVV